MDKEVKPLRVWLTPENSATVRAIAFEETSTHPVVANKLIAAAALKRAVKSLPAGTRKKS